MWDHVDGSEMRAVRAASRRCRRDALYSTVDYKPSARIDDVDEDLAWRLHYSVE